MKLVVFGATGGIGSQVVEQALAAGHQVTAVARSASTITIRHENLEICPGDVLDPQTVFAAVAGKDAVVSAVGVRDLAPTRLYSQGVANIIQAMQTTHARRLMCVSASGLEPGGFFERLVARLVLWNLLKEMYTDLVRMEDLVERSGLDWTILRPPMLTNGPRTGRYRVALNGHLSRGLRISRANLGEYIVSHLCNPATYCTRVEIAA